MDTTPLSNTSSDFIAFSDSDSSPNVNKTPKVYNNYNNKRISGYNNNNRNFNNRWSPKYTSPDNQQNQHWYRNNNRNKFYKVHLAILTTSINLFVPQELIYYWGLWTSTILDMSTFLVMSTSLIMRTALVMSTPLDVCPSLDMRTPLDMGNTLRYRVQL